MLLGGMIMYNEEDIPQYLKSFLDYMSTKIKLVIKILLQSLLKKRTLQN